MYLKIPVSIMIFQSIRATVSIAIFNVNSIPSFENSVDPYHLVSDDVWRLNEKFEKKFLAIKVIPPYV